MPPLQYPPFMQKTNPDLDQFDASRNRLADAAHGPPSAKPVSLMFPLADKPSALAIMTDIWFLR